MYCKLSVFATLILYNLVGNPVAAETEQKVEICQSKLGITEHFCCKTIAYSTRQFQHAFSKFNIVLRSSKHFDFEQFDDGGKEKKQTKKSLWAAMGYYVKSLFASNSKEVPEHILFLKLNPYKNKTICVSPTTDGKVNMRVNFQYEIYYLVLIIIGTTLFLASDYLSKSVTFHYSFSVGFGVICSLFLFVLILKRILPKKPVVYTFFLGWFSLCGWLYSALWSNIQTALQEYKWLLVLYAITMGFISFSICYWFGPVEDVRTQSIIKWGIQFLATVLLLCSSQRIEISLMYITILVFIHLDVLKVFSAAWNKLHSKFLFKFKWFRKEKRFLTEEEYIKQGQEETKKALEELRNFCNSPQCSPWKTLRDLKKPKKFASFVEGDSHVDNIEMSMYDEDFIEEDDSAVSSDEDSLPPEEINSTKDEEEQDAPNIEMDWNEQISEDEDSLIRN